MNPTNATSVMNLTNVIDANNVTNLTNVINANHVTNLTSVMNASNPKSQANPGGMVDGCQYCICLVSILTNNNG